jgi:hypothetical protein
LRLSPGELHAEKRVHVSLLNCTMTGRISEMSEDISDRVVAEKKASPYFTLQFDEPTDDASCEQLLLYASLGLKDELLFSESLTTGPRCVQNNAKSLR